MFLRVEAQRGGKFLESSYLSVFERMHERTLHIRSYDVISHLGMIHAVPNTTIVHFLKSVTYFSGGNEVVARQHDATSAIESRCYQIYHIKICSLFRATYG